MTARLLWRGPANTNRPGRQDNRERIQAAIDAGKSDRAIVREMKAVGEGVGVNTVRDVRRGGVKGVYQLLPRNS